MLSKRKVSTFFSPNGRVISTIIIIIIVTISIKFGVVENENENDDKRICKVQSLFVHPSRAVEEGPYSNSLQHEGISNDHNHPNPLARQVLPTRFR